MSIATAGGDDGRTSLIGGTRLSKADALVEAYGTIDELVAQMGFARSICEHDHARTLTRDLQQQLFGICEAIASSSPGGRARASVSSSWVDALTAEVHRLEQLDGIVLDWAIPGAHAGAAAYDVARTICRRAERAVVRLAESGRTVDRQVVPYLNRLSDLLWLVSRVVEHDAGADGRLRSDGTPASPWSRAW